MSCPMLVTVFHSDQFCCAQSRYMLSPNPRAPVTIIDDYSIQHCCTARVGACLYAHYVHYAHMHVCAERACMCMYVHRLYMYNMFVVYIRGCVCARATYSRRWQIYRREHQSLHQFLSPTKKRWLDSCTYCFLKFGRISRKK